MSDPAVDAVLILAAGVGSRFPGQLKQHLVIKGIRLIDRVISQCESADFTAKVIVSNNDTICSLEHIVIPPTGSPAETLQAARSAWGSSSTVFLFGDVYFTDAAISTILSSDVSSYYGDGYDNFAIRVKAEDYASFVECYNQSMSDAITPWALTWHVYRKWASVDDFPLTMGNNYAKYVFINDDTQDFDEPSDLASFLSGNFKNTAMNPTRFSGVSSKKLREVIEPPTG